MEENDSSLRLRPVPLCPLPMALPPEPPSTGGRSPPQAPPGREGSLPLPGGGVSAGGGSLPTSGLERYTHC
jgi:hypothetical protein